MLLNFRSLSSLSQLRSTTLAFLTLLLAGTAVSNQVNAQDNSQNNKHVTTDVTNNQKTDIETIVVTATKEQQTLDQIARAIDVLPAQQLNISEHSHIQQVFNQLPGVNFHRNSGQEYLAAIRSPVLTGAGACGEFLMLENSVPLRPAGMCNVNELIEAHHQTAQSIEVLRGPASVMYGGNGLHGVVNVITPKQPTDSAETHVSVGSHAYLKLKQNNKFANWQSAVTLIHDGGFRDDSGFDQQLITLKNQRNNPSFNTSTWLTAFNLTQQTAGYIEGVDAYKNDALARSNANPEAYRKASGLRLYQSYKSHSGWQISPYLRHSQMEFMQHFLPGQAIEENQQTSAGVLTKHRVNINDRLSIDYGVDLEIADIRLLEYQNNITAGSEFLQATIPAGKHYDYRVLSLSYAAFLLTQWQVNDDLSIETGLRMEQLTFDYDNNMLSGRTDEEGVSCGFGGCRFNRPEDREDHFSNLSPQVGVNYQLSNNSQLFLSLVHGFRMPQATELYRLQRQQSVADLTPTELVGIDSGWRYHSAKQTVSLGVFHYDKSNVIVRNSDFYNISGGKTRHQGIELSVQRTITPTWQLAGNISLAKHWYLNNPGISEQNIVGLDIDTAPRQMANLYVKYQQGFLRWQLHGQYLGDYFTNPENTHRYAGHVLWHWRSEYQLTDNLAMSFRLLNLTNRRYAERADYSSFGGDRYFPGKPRTVELSISVQY